MELWHSPLGNIFFWASALPRNSECLLLRLPNVLCTELNVFAATERCPLKTWGRTQNGSTWWLSITDLQNHDLGLVLEVWRSANFQRNFPKTGWHVLHCCVNLWLWSFSHISGWFILIFYVLTSYILFAIICGKVQCSVGDLCVCHQHCNDHDTFVTKGSLWIINIIDAILLLLIHYLIHICSLLMKTF